MATGQFRPPLTATRPGRRSAARYAGPGPWPRRPARRSTDGEPGLRPRSAAWAAYPDADGLPDGRDTGQPRLRVTPSWFADLRSRGDGAGTWARAGGQIDVLLLSPPGSAPAGQGPTAWTMTSEMLDLARASARGRRRGQRGVPPRPDRGDPRWPDRLGGRDHLQLRDQPVHRPGPPSSPEELPRPAARRPPGASPTIPRR